MGQRVPRTVSESFDLGKLLSFVGMHVMALVGLVVFPPTGELVALAALLYVVRMLGITVGYHRYFSHHAFRTSRPVQFALACWANLSLMRGPIPWVVAHRHHHRFADQSQDPHSPRRGFLWSHMGWFLSRESASLDMAPARDLEGFPELRALSQWYVVPTVVLFLALAWAGGWAWVVWGGPVSLVAAWHGTFAINSFGHGPSRLRRFATNDDSRNSFLLALLTCGEGWHNNHHHRMGLARHGLAWWEVDLSYGVICLLEALGLVWDVRRPGLEASTTPAGSEKSPAMTVSAEAKTSSPVVETYRKPSPSLA